MNRYLITLISLLCVGTLRAQSYSADDFIYPIKDVPGYYSGNFGELRPDHFHSGVDIKTDGEIGKRVVAVADGYISRISLSPYGYGLALYVAHSNGTTSVYGHLSRFSDEVAAYVERERYRTKTHTVNLYCNSKTFPVKQGELIAYSGNSGSSGGPHLHFEVRESALQQPINVVAKGIIQVVDSIAPLLFKMHYIETDTRQGVLRRADRKSYNVVKSGNGYTLSGGGSIKVGRSGYFVLEASDRRNNSTNTFAIYRVRATVDEQVFFEYAINKISFDRTRYSNAIGYYPLKIHSRNELIRLYATENGDLSHYEKLLNGGVISALAGESHKIKIEVYDDCGNLSECNFTIEGKEDEACFEAEDVDTSTIVTATKPFVYKADSVTVSIPSRALYESTIFTCTPLQPKDTTALSRSYKIMDVTIPLHKSMNVSIKADIPQELQSKVGMVCVGRSGYPSFIGGKYLGGTLTSSSRNTGEFYIVADTQAPKLRLNVAQGASSFSCTISDDLSGIKSYSATLDGEWIALDLDKGVLRHTFRNQPDGEKHTLVVTAIDGVGNKAVATADFIR